MDCVIPRAVLQALAENVLGGILASLIFLLCASLWSKLKKRRFKEVFGEGVAEDGMTLVYEEFVLQNTQVQYPYLKPDTHWAFSISRPISIASVRAVSYLASAIGKFSGKTPSVRSDLETKSLMDLDLVCFGGPGSNVVTKFCQDNSGNHLAVFDQPNSQFIRISDGKPLAKLDPKFDHGLILKIHPSQFPKRVWVACAGIGERGTSGSAWFLANKWQEIRKLAGNKPFAIVVRVEPDVLHGRDQSAELVAYTV